MPDLQTKLDSLPTRPGCYQLLDSKGDVLYVGKAQNLRSRVRSYFQESADHHPRIRLMVSRVADLRVMLTETVADALLLECNLVKRHRPPFNVRMRDDKQYPYLCLTMTEPFPRPIVVRRVKQDGNRYFGPYTSSSAMRQALRVIKSVFRLRSCARRIDEGDTQKLCLDYHIGLCSGPCGGKIARATYLRAVDEVTEFLQGKADRAMTQLRADMEEAAGALEFEQAARVRDQLRAIEAVVERQTAVSTELEDQDVVALVTDGVGTCAEVLQVRKGRLVGQNTLFLDGAHPDELADAARQFLQQFYQDTSFVPDRVLVNQPIEDAEVLEAWLSDRRRAAGSGVFPAFQPWLTGGDEVARRTRARVQLLHPVRGEKRRLTELAETNAREHLGQRRQAIARDQARADQALAELQEQLGLSSVPYRIECYDISNTMGQDSVGAMTVFEDGQPKKSEYRKFKIRTVEGPNDFASIQEVLRRRFQRAIEGDPRFAAWPDLVVIDGGKGQLSAATAVAQELGLEVAMIGLAKQFEEVFLPGRSEALMLPRPGQGLFLLQRIRDEAHRFGLTFHRKLRGRRQRKSALDEIPGIGEKRRRALLLQFGSVDKMRAASVEELARTPGMTRPAADRLYRVLHPDAG